MKLSKNLKNNVKPIKLSGTEFNGFMNGHHYVLAHPEYCDDVSYLELIQTAVNAAMDVAYILEIPESWSLKEFDVYVPIGNELLREAFLIDGIYNWEAADADESWEWGDFITPVLERSFFHSPGGKV